MIYLENFRFPTYEEEFNLLTDTEYSAPSTYPFGVLSERGLHSLDFSEITILYGGNGSGKSTALNIISNALDLPRNSAYNKGYDEMHNYYADLCTYKQGEWDDGLRLRDKATLITSDDIFKYMLDTRNKNEFVRKNAHRAVSEWKDLRYGKIRSVNFETGEGVEQLNQMRHAKRVSSAMYVEQKVGVVKDVFSNGETGFFRFMDNIVPDRLYILDEPENSLSCALQIELAKYIELSARYYGCQFIIATHSPFLMALETAKIYNLDGAPATLSRFWELPNMRAYFDLFMKFRQQFEETCADPTIAAKAYSAPSEEWREEVEEEPQTQTIYNGQRYYTIDEVKQLLEKKFFPRGEKVGSIVPQKEKNL